jgi:hypothetical protein
MYWTLLRADLWLELRQSTNTVDIEREREREREMF